jgi:tol-pal system protein YbgF
MAMTGVAVARWITTTSLLAALCAPAARAALFEDDEARKAILDLRAKLEQVSEQRRTGQAEQAVQIAQLVEQLAQLRRSLLELNNQLELLRADNARLRGQDETLARDIAELQRKQKDVQQGVDERIRKLEPVSVTVDGREFLADPEEKRQYEDAMAVLRKGEFDKAAVALAAFTRRYPGSGFAASAQFWLGNALYGKREYKDAIATFRALVASAADHPKAPEALLAIANCQLELKDGRSARKTIDELVKAYPKTEAAQAGRERLATIKP